jgi:hypothetical protein
MYKTASRNQQPHLGGLSQVSSNSEIKAKQDLRRRALENPEYEILIKNLTHLCQSPVKILRVIKKARPTKERLEAKEALKSRDFDDFRNSIADARGSLKIAVEKLSARTEKDEILTVVKKLYDELNKMTEALGIGEG